MCSNQALIQARSRVVSDQGAGRFGCDSLNLNIKIDLSSSDNILERSGCAECRVKLTYGYGV